MSLMKCRECGNEVSTDASACPQCGALNAAKGMGCGPWVVIVFVVFVVVGLLGNLLPKPGSTTPTSSPSPTPSFTGEDSKTSGLNCYDIGYRYGHTATSTMNGKQFNPGWDFAVPERCHNDPAYANGIQAGTKAAW